MSNKGRALLVLAYMLLFVALASRRGEVAWMAAPLLTYAIVGVLRAPRPRGIRLQATRRVTCDPSGKVEVALSVRNDGEILLPLVELRDSLAPGMAIEDGLTSTRMRLAPGEEAELRYTFCASRGRFSWTSVEAIVSDPLGMTSEHSAVPAPGEVHVHPEHARFRSLPLRPRWTLPSPGPIPARVGGSGIEFFGVREYQVGDPLRWLDWRLAARHPGRLFTKEFEREQVADIGLLLDARADADDRVGEESLFEHTVRAAASLAEVFLRQGHRASLLVLSEPGARVLPGFGRVHLQRILSCLAGVQVCADHLSPVSPALERSASRSFPAHSLVLFLSPCAIDDRPLLRQLTAEGKQVVLISPDTVDFHCRRPPADPVGRLAVRAARIERQLRLRAVAPLRVGVVDWQVSRPLYPLLCAALRPSRGGAVRIEDTLA
jgi:uncharacterized protein (DUF58 family)